MDICIKREDVFVKAGAKRTSNGSIMIKAGGVTFFLSPAQYTEILTTKDGTVVSVDRITGELSDSTRPDGSHYINLTARSAGGAIGDLPALDAVQTIVKKVPPAESTV